MPTQHIQRPRRKTGLVAALTQQRQPPDLHLRGLGRRRLGPNAIRSRDAAKEAIRTLAEAGHLLPVPGGADVRGERRREVWRVVRS